MELRAARLPDVVSLAQGIPSFDTPEPIRDYVREKIAAGDCSRYSLTPGLPKLRELIAESLRRDGMSYDPETEIIVSCGAIEAISATLLAAIEPGQEVVLPSPTYASYPEVIRMAGGVPRFVPLVEEQNFDLDPEAIARAVTRRTAAILFGNPNNPTGTVYSRAQIERVAAIAEENGCLLITDEVYKDFLYNDAELFTPARIDGLRSRVVRIFSFSKAYGMTGWRVGFLHSDAANVREILKIHDALVTCAPVASQYAAIAALELGDRTIEEFRLEFRRRRDRTLGHLDRLSHVFDYQKPNASYFVFPRVKDTVPLARDSRALAIDLLERGRVALVPGVAFGPTGEAHLRVSFSRRTEDLDLAFERIGDYFDRAWRSGLGADHRARDLPSTSEPPRKPPRAHHGTARLRTAGIRVLQLLSRRYLARVRPRCVAIAGLGGKTVMKRWLREMLEPVRRVRANPRSYNTEVGLPLAVLGTEIEGRGVRAAVEAVARATVHGLFSREPVDVLILEMGLRRAGDARALLGSVLPDVLVLTPIAPSFTGDVSFLRTIETEVATLAREVAGRGGAVVACRDDARVVAAIEGVPRVTTFGREQVRIDGSGRFALESGGATYDVGLDAVGDSSFYALLAGVEVARLLGVEDAALRRFLTGGRFTH
ncbi:MAG: aminotransferase [Candidatus Binatota bacterium]|nr:aminotransferase [Candidatus Binatota bacterium]